MEEKEIKMMWEVMGDYDGILYHEYTDDTKKNIHTNTYFDKTKSVNDYSPLYQYKDGKLVAFSTHKAEGLLYDDDINQGKNLLWGGRGIDGKQELIFKPIKELSIPHIKKIITEGHTQKPEYLKAFTERLTSVITIKQNE